VAWLWAVQLAAGVVLRLLDIGTAAQRLGMVVLLLQLHLVLQAADE
jgi:hypothetical protein